MILQLYFFEELNLQEIGLTLDVSAARVCQIKRDAMAKIEGYRKTIRVDPACELAHQKLSDIARLANRGGR